MLTAVTGPQLLLNDTVIDLMWHTQQICSGWVPGSVPQVPVNVNRCCQVAVMGQESDLAATVDIDRDSTYIIQCEAGLGCRQISEA